MTTPMIDDEVAARAAFADLSAGQPPFAAGRFAAVKHRAVLRRRRQLAGGALAVAAAVALAVSVSQLADGQRPQPPARSVPRWALSWPDHRNGSVPQQVLDRAVIAALYGGQGAQAPALQLPDGGGSISCDSQTDQLPVPAADLHGHGHQLWLEFSAPDLDALELDFGTMR
jgi:hypothetical protein